MEGLGGGKWQMANGPEQWTLTAKQSLHLSAAFYLIFLNMREKEAEREEAVKFNFLFFYRKSRTAGCIWMKLCWCFEVLPVPLRLSAVPLFYISTFMVTKGTMADFHLT